MQEQNRFNAEVSIHTPTKGVTPSGKSWLDAYRVSIHTPTKGVTQVVDLIQSKKQVSIHTPTKGVTQVAEMLYTLTKGFNPHTHEGCDELLFKIIDSNGKFQSTHPRRV